MEKNLKWCVLDSNISDGAIETLTPYESKEEAMNAGCSDWEHLTKREQEKRDMFLVGLCNVEPYELGKEKGWQFATLPDGSVDSDIYKVAKRWK